MGYRIETIDVSGIRTSRRGRIGGELGAISGHNGRKHHMDVGEGLRGLVGSIFGSNGYTVNFIT